MIGALRSVVLLLLCLPFLGATLGAQTQTTTAATSVREADVGPGEIVQDGSGREVSCGVGGNVRVSYRGKLRPHASKPGIQVCDEIVGAHVRSGGTKNLGVKGTMSVQVDATGATVTSSGTGQGTPPSTDGASIKVVGDGVTVNANGTNTSINCSNGAQGTTINTGAGSSGSISCPGTGYNGSMNIGAGSGSWSLNPRR